MLEYIVIATAKVLAVIAVVLTGCAYSTYLERKVVAFMQTVRTGIHRTDPVLSAREVHGKTR